MKNTTSVGVVVGRFQVPKLHPAHEEFINEVRRRHEHLVIFIGVHPFPGTKSNPLDYPTRHYMLAKLYPDAIIMPIKDTGKGKSADDLWSVSLDSMIRGVFPFSEATIYGGRDSCLQHYRGKMKTCDLLGSLPYQGTDVRARIHRSMLTTEEAREGAIHLAGNMYPRVNPTVDIAIVRPPRDERVAATKDSFGWQLLLAAKPGEDKWRFVGGFVDRSDQCLEWAARREVAEETGVEIDQTLDYIGSCNVPDWRCTDDAIMTTFFAATYLSGAATANDDICKVKWFDFVNLGYVQVNETHQKLMEMFITRFASSRSPVNGVGNQTFSESGS